MKQKSEEEIRKSKRRFFRGQIVLFGMLMAAGTVLGALWMLRPQRSEREKRELTAFPEFTMESFLDGSFLGDISTWYADTFPLREEWIRVDQGMESLYGIRTSQILGGGDKTADEIPVIETSSLEESVPEESSREDSVREESEVQESSAAEDQQEESLPPYRMIRRRCRRPSRARFRTDSSFTGTRPILVISSPSIRRTGTSRC